jgi:hypothetical protein
MVSTTKSTALCVAPFVLAGILAACNDSPPTPAPSPLPSDPTPAPSSLAVSGVVLEHTAEGSRPLAGLRFLMRFSADQPWDYDNPGSTSVTSDGNGRYLVAAPIGSLVAIEIPAEAGYHAPCPSGFDHLAGNANMDIHVVADTILSSTGRPQSVPYTRVWISGTVMEGSYDDARPVAGASVELAGEVGAPLRSVTLSDADGRFFVCTNPPGAGADQSMWLTASKEGYRPDSRAVLMGRDDQVSLTLVRN